MSKSLHDQVKAIILRMENERLKQEAEKAKAEKAHTKEAIMARLDSSLEVCLNCFDDYNGHYFEGGMSLPFFEEAARELGFDVSYQLSKRSYHMSIPAFEKGTRRTPAQLKLYHFQQKLARARNERKAELLSECKRVKELIRKGKFTYDSDNQFTVETEKSVGCSFECEVVTSFFSKFKLQFIGTGYTNCDWVFSL